MAKPKQRGPFQETAAGEESMPTSLSPGTHHSATWRQGLEDKEDFEILGGKEM